MSRRKTNHQASVAASTAWRRAHQAAARLRPLAMTTGAAARGRVHRTRAWAAPRVERTGQVLQDSVAPKVSALLSSAARRLEPAKPRRPRWRKLAGISVATAAAGAVAVGVRNRRKPDVTTPAAEPDAGDVAPTAHRRDGPAMASTGAHADGQVRTS